MCLVTAPLYTARLLHTESLMISTVTSIRLVEAMPVVKTRMCLFLRVLKKDVEVGVLGKHRWSYTLFGTKQIEVTIYKSFSWLSSVSKYISLSALTYTAKLETSRLTGKLSLSPILGLALACTVLFPSSCFVIDVFSYYPFIIIYYP